MTNSRSIQQQTSKTVRKGLSSQGTADPTELVIAELRLRRERLKQLLNMIEVEVGHQNAAREPSIPRHTCTAKRRNSQT